MQRVRIAETYESKWLEIERPSPLSDNKIEHVIQGVLSGDLDKDITDAVYDNFKLEAEEWILGSTLNALTGLASYARKDIIIGCTQFIDNLYMQGPVQTLRGDYKYHERLGNSYIKDVGSLIPDIPLIVAMPFPKVGEAHPDMLEILDEALVKRIPVHIDGAWVTCSKDINFDFSHPAIKSVGISLSKGLGLGWNRVGIRWSRYSNIQDSIAIMNDFRMNNRALAMIGLHFVRNFEKDYLWKTHCDSYFKICKDFDLTPTNSIHLALKDNSPVGVSPLIRYLENVNNTI